MQLLDGKTLSSQIKAQLAEETKRLKTQKQIVPGLAVILIGSDPASELYVQMKAKACEEVGVYSVVHKMPQSVNLADIIDTIKMINKNPFLDGLLVQLPLPPQINASALIEQIAVEKDVDGFHPHNFGRLFAGMETFAPCTPLGVMRLLEAYGIDTRSKNAVVVGASSIVGKPMAALLLNAGATVDVCHILTADLAEHTKRADLLFVGVGKAGLITEDMVKQGAVVVDIGTNRIDGKLKGDVDFDRVAPKCSYITPVPGGVGPMTIAMLLSNTIKAANHRKTDEK
ncbi:MAG: bifunctional methylenetetrahydrofolate dehydrogenase/methenyltetrahydrofolate cyclohydrolase FolD [Helicobacteraceae bacterium]|jgi:methylenetetrahydrofolate dehydrogenase (NADP+)/methenyltetrahydrofolate cyclohydrolase|nr:bifunctional methylenetetrahydrofolate dehydrogenase/methenyltetrahydrofolate cyclohydrolase FolD [Helicobacteraceae bacterium]